MTNDAAEPVFEPAPAQLGPQSDPHEPPAWTARKLLRGARSGTLATAGGGQPFASLVTPAIAPDGAILMLLSGLSEHTRHLRADGRCAVMVVGAAQGANPQTAPRVTVTGRVAPTPDSELKERWLAVHPYAAFYAGFGDFVLWRLVPTGAAFVGGFARAARLPAHDIVPPAEAVAALREAEPGILSHCNDDHAGALDLIAHGAGGTGDGWRMVAADVDGCDLARGETVLRIDWSAPVTDAAAVRGELVRLTRSARG